MRKSSGRWSRGRSASGHSTATSTLRMAGPSQQSGACGATSPTLPHSSEGRLALCCSWSARRAALLPQVASVLLACATLLPACRSGSRTGPAAIASRPALRADQWHRTVPVHCSVKNITARIFSVIIKVCNGQEPEEVPPPTPSQLRQAAARGATARWPNPPPEGAGSWAILITLYRVSSSQDQLTATAADATHSGAVSWGLCGNTLVAASDAGDTAEDSHHLPVRACGAYRSTVGRRMRRQPTASPPTTLQDAVRSSAVPAQQRAGAHVTAVFVS